MIATVLENLQCECGSCMIRGSLPASDHKVYSCTDPNCKHYGKQFKARQVELVELAMSRKMVNKYGTIHIEVPECAESCKPA